MAARRLIRQGRLLVLVLTVAILASTAVTSIGLLVTATEQSAVRTSLDAVPASQTEMSVDVDTTTVSIAKTTARSDAAIQAVLGSAATATHTIRAYTPVYPVGTPANKSSQGYFGELAGVAKRVAVTSGALPSTPVTTGATTVDVAVPTEAATALGLKLGTKLTYVGGTNPVTLDVVGIYNFKDPQAEFWSQDPLSTAGNSAGYFSPTGDQLTPVDAFGPMLVAPGSLDAIGAKADRIQINYDPSFARTGVDQLDSLIQRVNNADSDVPSDVGDLARVVSYSGDAGVPLGQIASALVVTRSTVVVITLLLLVLSIAALTQAARLFNEARAGDRELMRARGASSGQLLGIAFLEAGVVGIVTAAVSAPLARLVYFIIARQPALRSARVPVDAGLPWTAWATSLGLGALFVLVLIVSLLGRSGSFVAAEQNRSRGRRVTGLLRSGLDFGVVVIAVIAFWQLSIYRSPVGVTTSLSVDPILVAAPALVLLAGSLLAARLFPLLARLVDWWGSHASSGVLLRLASWEIGRRSQRATAVVLLLTLALAVGTFSQTFLATWRQSQVDQANYAVGPSVRVPAVTGDPGAQRSLLTTPATGAPQPVIRRVADVATDGQDGEDTDAVVLGLTPGARAMLDHGQLAVDGGSAIASSLKGSSTPVTGVPLPGDPDGISAEVRVGDTADPLPGVLADVSAIVQDGAGVLTTVDLGHVALDGAPHSVSGLFAAVPHGGKRTLPIRFVGVQMNVYVGNSAVYSPNPPTQTKFLLGKIAGFDVAADGSTTAHPASATASPRWYASTDEGEESPVSPVKVAGWQLGLQIGIPNDVQGNPPGAYVATAWPSVTEIPAVMNTALAKTIDVKTGTILEMNFASTTVEVNVVAITKLIPGAVDGSLLTPTAAAGADASGSGAVVVDQSALERALVGGATTGPMVDEWWVNVPAGDGASYVAAHPTASSSEVLALAMQQDPLRVATQAALWLAIAAAALLAAIGFAVHSASTLAARRIELAQLRAIGLSRRRVVSLIAAESLLLCAIGVLFGLVVGVVLGLLASPLIALSPNGLPAVPQVRVIVPWLEVAVLVLVVVAVLLVVVAAVSRGQRASNPANILREADNG